MGRSGYTDDGDDNWALIKWRGQVASAIRGRRGQSFLRELAEALDAMPEKRLIAHELQQSAPAFVPPQFSRAEVCAIGSLGVARGIDMRELDPENYDAIADAFGVAHQLVREIEFENDEASWSAETPEQRWVRMREWVRGKLKDAA